MVGGIVPFRICLLLVALVLAAGPAGAGGLGDFELSGYGELGFAFLDHGADRNREGGALDDRRLEFDTTRLVLELEQELPGDLEIEAEVEFEHGGTGVTREIEYEEFGEFETEVEKGGEVIVEELYIQKSFGRVDAKVGRFYVAFGRLSDYFRPIDYLGVVRSEAETLATPGQWDEMGGSVTVHLPRVTLTGQLVNGLDSTGFSSARWVASGHQTAFETVRASDLAAVLRVDVGVVPWLDVGASGYAGGSSKNRPKADLVKSCSDPDSDNVAPCGYVSGTVAMADLHAFWRGGGVRGSAWAMWGHLENADLISQRNDRLSNTSGVDRTPVGDNAIAFAAEVGYDVAPHLALVAAHRLEPYVGVDYLDTMVASRDSLFDNPRYERTVLGVGASYIYLDSIVAKLEWSHRRFGSSDLRAENTVRTMAGFVF
jgi:hypothetical protein